MNKRDQALPLVVRPAAGESAAGFLMRLAEANGFSYPWLYVRVAGGRYNPDKWGDLQWQHLADLAGLDVEEFKDMRQRPVDDPHMHSAVSFLGTAVRRTFLTFDQMRLCPHCIAEGGVLREMWKLAHCVACIEHGTYLEDHCDCGRPVHLIKRGPRLIHAS